MMGDLQTEEIEAVLRSEVVGRIGYVFNGWPYIVPVTYVYDGAEYVYVHSAEGQKLAAMRAFTRVCFEVEQVQSPGNWRTAVTRGRFQELERDEEERAMELLAGKFAWLKPGAEPQDRQEEVHRRAGIVRPVLFRIHLLEKRGRYALS